MSVATHGRPVRAAPSMATPAPTDPDPRTERRGRILFWAGVGLLIVAIFAPLLRSGVVLQLDTPTNLVGPFPRASMAVGGASAEFAARVPIDRVLTALFTLVPWGWVRLLPMISAIPLAAWGWARCFRGRWLVAGGATGISVVNPFMYERMVAGQVYLVLAFGLMPLLLSLVWDERSRRRMMAIGLLLALQVALSLHLAFIAGVLLAIFVASHLFARRWRDALHLIGAGAVALVASAYWLPAALRASAGFDRIGTGDLLAFRSAADPAFGLFPNLIGLYGFWRRGWVLPKDFLRTWPLFLLALLVVSAIGLIRSWRGLGRRCLAPLLCLGVIGLLLAAGDQGPAGGIYQSLFDHIGVFRVMREPQKWLELLVLLYAAAFGLGLDAIVRTIATAKTRAVATLIILSIPIAYAFTMLWGFDAVAPSHYPASWTQANEAMGDGPGAIVALPWHRYLPLPWTQDRVVSNPMVSAFSRDVVVSEDPEFGGVPTEGSDPLSAHVGQILRVGANGQPVAQSLSRLGVSYLVLAEVNDWQRWSWLQDAPGIRIVHRWPDLILLKVTPGGSSVLADP